MKAIGLNNLIKLYKTWVAEHQVEVNLGEEAIEE